MRTAERDRILGARHLGEARLINLSWEPRSGDTLFITPGQQRATAAGVHPFADDLRAIVLHALRVVAFRPYWPKWAQTSQYAQKGPDDAVRSFDAQWARMAALQAMGGSGWTYRLGITNTAIGALMGTPARLW